MIYELKDLTQFLSTINTKDIIKSKDKIYYNLAMSFDIETSSFYEDKNGVIYTNDDYRKLKNTVKADKKAIMYIWQFAIEENVIIGRTWNDFLYFCKKLYDFLNLKERYIVVYVHNLSYEFQFICKWFNWIDIFADSERKPIKATTDTHFIFKCSYRLSGYSLEVLANNLKSHNIKKMVGDLDYNLIRNSKTPISKEELKYCENDVLIVTSYIDEQINEFGNIEKIPLTQTGKVRRYVRKQCFQNKEYQYFIKELTIEKPEYMLLKNAFMGGFTHCNAMYTNKICQNVTSYDFTSSYPTVLISEKYPMSKGKEVYITTETELLNLIKNYCVLVDLQFTNIKTSFMYEQIISYSKCRNVKNPLINNGRIVQAETLTITCTDIDFLNIKDFYKWDSMKIGLCYIYKKDYLPKEFIKTILHLYKSKTELKGVDGKEVEYLHSKELLNSLYGMCVTSIVHDTVNFNGAEWTTENGNLDEELKNYNTDKNRFLFYHWGVWCTAYARNNLYTGIKECKDDYIYSDTDSIKIFNADKHKNYFEKYNEWIVQKLEKCLKYHNIPLDYISPKTIKGESKTLGVWDFDGFYTDFKTLGAKRYIYRKDDKISITVCGLSKKSGKEFIENQQKPFLFFNDGMFVDCEHTGKMTHTYIDREIENIITDYLGNQAYYHEKSFIHLEKTDYLLSLSDMYIKYFMGVQKLIK
mgnify:CR=1 FL=1|jgi:hypothetical protein